jgi:hypothetical protein
MTNKLPQNSIGVNLLDIEPTHLGYDCGDATPSILLGQECCTFMLIEVQAGSGETLSLLPLTSQTIYTKVHHNAHNGSHLHGVP